MGAPADPVRVRVRSDIALVEIDHPPVNALALPVRRALLEAIEALDADRTVRAIVLRGRGRHFAAGADIREFEHGQGTPLLNDVLLRLEAVAKPVIAALHGTVLGGGAEVALASHYRCARRNLSLGLPEINLGLLPGSGGTVRLPRLIGAQPALELMLSGRPIDAETAHELGLIDRIVESDDGAGRDEGAQAGAGARADQAALAYAAELLAGGAGARRTRDRPAPPVPGAEFFATQRRRLPPKLRPIPAATAVIDAVEACCTSPFETALQRARTLFEQCRRSPESRALRHLFFAERGASSCGAPRAVARIAVVGAGTMGRGIALSVARAGYAVTLLDADPSALVTALEEMTRTLEQQARRGQKGAEPAQIMRHVLAEDALPAVGGADLVIEAVYEDLVVKRELFEQLGRLCRPGAVLASNTSTLDIEVMANASGRPGDVVGMHFFSPVHLTRVVEVVQGVRSAPDTVATALGVSKRLGKCGLIVGNRFGFVGNRMLYAYGREKELLMLEGAEPAQVDRALEAFGMAMGPNAVADLAGLDVGYAARRAWLQRPRDVRFYRVSDLLVESGRLGRKSGRGFYLYPDPAHRGAPDPPVSALIRAEAQRLGISQRRIDDEEIVERCLTALVNEGGRLLDEGVARSAADIDAIWCGGYGFPRYRGGPMFYAEQLGRDLVRQRVGRFARRFGSEYWTAAEWLNR